MRASKILDCILEKWWRAEERQHNPEKCLAVPLRGWWLPRGVQSGVGGDVVIGAVRGTILVHQLATSFVKNLY